MRQAKFWAIAPFGLLSNLGKSLLVPLLFFSPVFIYPSYSNQILAQESSESPSPEITPTPEESPSPEITPTPEESPSPEITPTPEESPSPEITPTPEESPSPEITPTPEESPSPEQKVILQQEGDLNDGDSVLPSDQSIYDEHTFEGREGQVVTVTLESSDFDTYLAVFSPTGELLGEHDDLTQKNTNSQLTITLPVPGAYRVIVNSYDKTGRGQYSLKVIESGQTSDL